MKTAELDQAQPLIVKTENLIQMPLGLLGFEEIKEYVLLANPEEEPFMWLQMVHNPSHAFLAISPYRLLPDYQPEISQEDVDFLQLQTADDALLLNIITLRPEGRATANMKGPIVLNRHTLVGKQVIPLNVSDFDLQYPLPFAE